MAAVHRSILIVDIAGYGDRRRTNHNQLAVRESLYRLLAEALQAAGIPWADCDRVHSGDGVLIVIPPSVAKSVLVESLPVELVSALREHNQVHPAQEQIRLRMVLHAGEIHYDEHGVVGRAVVHAFRLLDAREIKQALAESGGDLAIITSSWFYEEVVWHTGIRAGYQRVRVTVKETETTAWICVPGHRVALRASTTAADQGLVPQQLPAHTRQFAGRAAELRELAGLLDTALRQSGTVIITAIDGTAGIGKTALAMFWAHQAKDRFPDGQLHVNLRGFDPQAPMDPGQALHGFLLALDVSPSRIPADLDAKAALYRTLLAGRRMLIMLDNARSTDHVRPLLPGAPGCLVIVTSRNRLDSLAVRDGANRITLGLLSIKDAFELLARRLDRIRLELELGSTAELIELCARLPLALSIVAARAEQQPAMPVSQLVRELRDERGRLDALDLGYTDLDLRAVFSWSYTILSKPAARLFRLLSVQPGPDIDRNACAALTGEPGITALLKELTGAHLLDEHAPGRFRFHDLLRAYATDRAEHDEPESLRDKALRDILDYYRHAALLAECLIEPGLAKPPSASHAPDVGTYAEAMRWFTEESPVLQQCVVSATSNGFYDHAGAIAAACTTFLRRTGRRLERAEVQRIALDAARRAENPAAQATFLRGLSRAVSRLGRHEEALDLLHEALTLCEILADEHSEYLTHLYYARTFELQRRHAEALSHVQQAWELARLVGTQLDRASVLTVLSRQRARLGDHTAALPTCEQALGLYTQLGHLEGEADALATLGFIKHGLGRHGEAIACYERSLDLDRQLGDQYWEAFTLDHLGDAYRDTGESDRAALVWAKALAILDDLRLPDAEEIRFKLTRLATAPQPAQQASLPSSPN